MRTLIVCEGKHEGSGAMEALVMRLSGREMRFEHAPVNRSDMHSFHGKGRGFFKKAVGWMRKAKRDGFDALVLVIDEDGDPTRTQQLTDAQKCSMATISRALGVAVRTFDAWMLADEKALSGALEQMIPRQADPEDMIHPKHVCRSLLGESKTRMRQRDMYTRVAEAVKFEVLEKRCPLGFKPFARRVRAL